MKKAWIKLMFCFLACLLLVINGDCWAQEEEQTQTAEQPTPTPEEQPVPAQGTPAQEPQPVTGQLPPPLKAEMVVAEHWSKNPYPRTVAAGSRVHIVEKGDTLWDLAARYYNNPFLWPHIWEANNYIPNAHWIYPGDPIVIPPLAPISEEQIAQQAPPSAEEIPAKPAEPGAPGAPIVVSRGKQALPIALDMDLYCSGFIVDTTEGWKLKIIGNEENIQKVSQALFDVVYINQGEADGISPGDEFTIVRKVRSLEHPVTLEPLGDYVLQTGRLKVVATQEKTSTAQVTYSCDATLVGDYLIPFEPREAPVFSDMPPVDRYSVEGPNQKGYIVFAKDDLTSLGVGHEVQLDIGSAQGVTVGTRLIIYRPQKKGYEQTTFAEDLPRRVIGEMVVFSVQEKTSTGRIIQMYDFAEIGDRVEIR